MPATADLFRERSHRLPRACYRGEVAVAFTARLTAGSHPFSLRDGVRPLVAALAACALQHECVVPIYCFMPDHVHLIIRGVTASADAWSAMTAFKQRSGYWFARHRPGTRWQKDFYDRILRDEGEIRDAILYIAANPLRAGLARDPVEYPFTGTIDLEPTGSSGP